MTAEADIAVIVDAGDVAPNEVNTALTSVLGEIPMWMRRFNGRLSDETAHADDKFFPHGVAHGGTEILPTGTATWTQEDDVLAGTADDQVQGDLAGVLWDLTPSAFPVTIETVVRALAPAANFAQVGLAFTAGVADTDSAIYATVGHSTFGVNSGTITNINANESILGNIATNPPGAWYYLRLIWKDTNTFKMGRSASGRVWDYTGDLAHILATTHYGVICTAYGAGNPTQAAFEYVRVYEADLSA